MADYVHVQNEPRHRHQFENDYVRVYDVLIPVGDTTLYHEHTEDTIYVSIKAAKVQDQTFGETEVRAGELGPGIALCRPHKDEPLIHQVTNVGEDEMRMIGIEVKASAPNKAQNPLGKPFEEVWVRSRVRAYKWALAPDETMPNMDHPFSSATVFLTDCALRTDSRITRHTAGDILWQDGPVTQTVQNVGLTACQGYLFEWL